MIQQFHSCIYIRRKQNTNSKIYMQCNVHNGIIYNNQNMAYQVYHLKISLPSSRQPFCFVNSLFCGAKLFSLMWSHLFIFASVSLAQGDVSKKILLRLTSKSLLTMFSSRSFMVLGLRFKSLIYFGYFFCAW